MVNAITPQLLLLKQVLAPPAGPRHCAVCRWLRRFPPIVGLLRMGIQRIALRLYLYGQALSIYGEQIPKRGSLSTSTQTASVKPPPRNGMCSTDGGITAAFGSSSSSKAVSKTSIPKRSPLQKLTRGEKPPPGRYVVEQANRPELPQRYWNTSQHTPGTVLASTIPNLGLVGPAPNMGYCTVRADCSAFESNASR